MLRCGGQWGGGKLKNKARPVFLIKIAIIIKSTLFGAGYENRRLHDSYQAIILAGDGNRPLHRLWRERICPQRRAETHLLSLPILRSSKMERDRESNSRPLLGKQVYCHCTNPAYCYGGQVYSDLDYDNGSEPHRIPTLVGPLYYTRKV